MPQVWAEWKKEVIHKGIEGRGIPNVAVAADWDGDGAMDAMTSFDNGVTVFRGPDWKRPAKSPASRMPIMAKEN